MEDKFLVKKNKKKITFKIIFRVDFIRKNPQFMTLFVLYYTCRQNSSNITPAVFKYCSNTSHNNGSAPDFYREVGPGINPASPTMILRSCRIIVYLRYVYLRYV